MSNGKIKRITDRGFGFIEMTGSEEDMFFHMSACQDCDFEDLKEGQSVSFELGNGPKGPRAENVRLT